MRYDTHLFNNVSLTVLFGGNDNSIQSLFGYVHTREGQNNGKTTQYRNKAVCVGCTERTLVLYFVILLFVYAV